MEQVYTTLTQRALDIYRDRIGSDGGGGGSAPPPSSSCSQPQPHRKQTRIVIALAGPPGSGKTTVADEVARRINDSSSTYTGTDSTGTVPVPAPVASVLPMDGFHYPRAHLDTLPNRAEAYARRGAAWTFDADGVVALVRRLRESSYHNNGSTKETETTTTKTTPTILAPSFDHAAKDPVPDSIRIDPSVSVVIVEGLYVLLDRAPWSSIRALVDDAWFVDVDAETAGRRIASRHLAAGIETRMEDAVRRAGENDLPNGEEVRGNLVEGVGCVVRSVDEVVGKH